MTSIKIFTLKFNKETECFEDDMLQDFHSNHIVHDSDHHFFNDGQNKYLTIILTYEDKMTQNNQKHVYKTKKGKIDLDESEQMLFNKLKRLRNEKAISLGLPSYVLGTNRELAEIVRNKCVTKEALHLIEGFGKQKIEAVGEAFIAVIKKELKTEVMTDA